MNATETEKEFFILSNRKGAYGYLLDFVVFGQLIRPITPSYQASVLSENMASHVNDFAIPSSRLHLTV